MHLGVHEGDDDKRSRPCTCNKAQNSPAGPELKGAVMNAA